MDGQPALGEVHLSPPLAALPLAADMPVGGCPFPQSALQWNSSPMTAHSLPHPSMKWSTNQLYTLKKGRVSPSVPSIVSSAVLVNQLAEKKETPDSQHLTISLL